MTLQLGLRILALLAFVGAASILLLHPGLVGSGGMQVAALIAHN